MSELSASGSNLVTIASFQEPMEANMARTALESAGIDVAVQGETANSLIPVAFEAQLQVRAEDEAAARAILSGIETSPETQESVEAAEIAGEQAPQ